MPLGGSAWRVVEAQHQVSTLKLVDTPEEQALLETLIEQTKPAVPPECRHLHYLLATPFRYGAPYPTGSRFRRAGMTPGVYYAAEQPETAMAETAFHRLMFFAESPETPWPTNPAVLTAFSTDFATAHALDLTQGPLAADSPAWTHPTDYGPCQALAEAARSSGIEAIRYESTRDPQRGANLALLACTVFMSAAPQMWATWRLQLGPNGAHAVREMPLLHIAFGRDAFSADPRLGDMRWER